jgi:LPXTG-site transpeptidase (sortase) family protein
MITIPKINLNRTVYQGIEDPALANGVGHGNWSAAPGGAGHCMIFGHRTSHGGPFRGLNLLKPGDPITTGGVTYSVAKIEILSIADKVKIWTYNGGGKRLSLVACSKPNGEPTSLNYRIVVRAQA